MRLCHESKIDVMSLATQHSNENILKTRLDRMNWNGDNTVYV